MSGHDPGNVLCLVGCCLTVNDTVDANAFLKCVTGTLNSQV